MKATITIFIGLVLTGSAIGQFPVDFPFRTQLDRDNNLCITGHENSNYLTEKYNFQAVRIWRKIFKTAEFSRGYGICTSEQGDVLSSGHVLNPSTASNDIAVFKYNKITGEIVWNRFLESLYDDKSLSLAVDNSGNIYFTGFQTDKYGCKNAVTVKFSPGGTLLWSRTYDNRLHKGDDAGTHILVDSGYVYVAGSTYNGSYFGKDIVMLRYTLDGEDAGDPFIFPVAKTDETPTGFVISELAQSRINKSRTCVSVISEAPVSGGVSQFLTLAFEGGIGYEQSLRWHRYFSHDNTKQNIAASIAADRHGDVYVTGYVHRGQASGYDYATIKYNKDDGSYGWNPPVAFFDYSQNPGGDDKASSLKLTSDGNIYVAGSSSNSPNGYSIVSYSQTGSTVTADWTGTFKPSFSEASPPDFFSRAAEVMVDTEGMPVMTAMIWDEAGNADYAVRKYDRNGNILFTIDDGMDVPSSRDNISYENLKTSETAVRLSGYPNPFNPATKISYTLRENSDVSLKIFDTSGKMIRELHKGVKQAGEHSADFNAAELPSGIYHAVLRAGEQTAQLRLALVK